MLEIIVAWAVGFSLGYLLGSVAPIWLALPVAGFICGWSMTVSLVASVFALALCIGCSIAPLRFTWTRRDRE